MQKTKTKTVKNELQTAKLRATANVTMCKALVGGQARLLPHRPFASLRASAVCSCRGCCRLAAIAI